MHLFYCDIIKIMYIQQTDIFVQLKVSDKYIFMLIRKSSHPSEIFAKVRT